MATNLSKDQKLFPIIFPYAFKIPIFVATNGRPKMPTRVKSSVKTSMTVTKKEKEMVRWMPRR
uniref:Uncharacterized protein n=1 Tax=Hyaloperonospora arabidopsidis (strain Emoy2) TaxID=559515 RepID=M4B3W5_HYAAE